MRRGEPSVCKRKSMRQTKLCDFNRLRGGTIYAQMDPESTVWNTISLLLSYIYYRIATWYANLARGRSIHLRVFGRFPCTDAVLREG
jgi:hypothetical protein